MAPEGVTAPDFNHNVVQWVNFDDAGFAYADAQMDPRSGEILHAQVFFTSAFAVGGRAEARSFLRRHSERMVNDTTVASREARAASAAASGKAISLRGFSGNRLCNRDDSANLARGLNALLESNASDAVILKASQDYVREVVAHEIGHTLGLRHNFAGSTAVNYPLSTREGLAKAYFTDGGRTPDGVVTTSSVMEYNMFEESIMAGDQISRGVAAFAYDIKAMRSLYFGEKFAASEIPLFCTDSHLFRYADCIPFDTGSSVVEYAAWQRKDAAKSMPSLIANMMLSRLAPPAGYEPRPLESFDLNPLGVALNLQFANIDTLGLLSSNTKLIRIDRQFEHITSMNRGDLAARQSDYIASELERFGGLSALLAKVEATYPADLAGGLKGLMRLPAYRNFVGLDGQAHMISEAQLALIDRIADHLAANLPAALTKADMMILGFAGGMRDSELTDGLLEMFKMRANEVVFAAEGNVTGTLANDDGTTKDVTVPRFVFDLSTRKLAAGLLSRSRTDAPEWILQAKAESKARLDKIANDSFGAGLNTVAAESVSRELARWLLENRDVNNAFDFSDSMGF